MAQANNKIQIKRSVANAVVTGLANGELAFTQASNTLWIGLPDGSGTASIGGVRNPGTLTANQALVANSTSGIDKIIVANAAITKIYTTANGYGGAGYILATDASGNIYWTSPGSVAVTPAGSNTQVQFNDSGSLGATSGFTFDKASNTLTISNTTSTVELQVSGKLKANGSYGTAAQVLSSNSTGGIYWAAATPATNVDAQYVWTNTHTFNAGILANTVNATSYTAGVYGSISGGLLANSTIIAVGNSSVNATINSTAFSGTANNASYLGGVGASSYATKTYADSAYSNAMADTLSRDGAYTGNNTFGGTNTVFNSNTFINGTVTVNNTISVNGHILPISNVAFDLGSSTMSFRHLYVGGSSVYLGSLHLYDNSGTLQVNATSGGTASGLSVANLVTSTNTLTIGTGSYFVSNGNLGIGNSTPADKLSVNGTTNLAGNVNITGANVDMTSAQLRVRDLVASGNLTIQGTLTTIDTNQLQVKDASIKVADQQASSGTFTDALDFTFYGTFGNTSNAQFAGFYRDHSASSGTSSVFKLFTSNTEPGGTVDNTAIGYVLGTLNSYLTTGAFVANSSVVNITANSTVSSAIVANTLSLSTALTATNGGTGQSSFTVGDVLYASATNAISKLGVGSPGTVLQISDANLPAYYSLDGGTF